MSNLLQRVLTGVIGVAAIITVIWLSPWGTFAFCLLVGLAGYFEYSKLLGMLKKPTTWVMLVGTLLFFCLGTLGKELVELPGAYAAIWAQKGKWAIWALFLPVIALLTLFDKSEKTPVDTLAKLIFGFVYTVLPLWLLADFSLPFSSNALVPKEILMGGAGPEVYAPHIPLGFMFMVWATDTFAYFGGRFMGKHKLMERISPKKTWEGSISGSLGCIGFGVIFGLVWDDPGLAFFLPASFLVAVFSQLGDLVESMFKRSLKIKDSGGILPGHGGILDRFDGFYLALPFVWAYALAYLHLLS